MIDLPSSNARVPELPTDAHPQLPHVSKPRVSRWTCWLALALAGCSQQLIPNTDVEDTQENRSLVEFCELYRHAVEHRDIDKLLTLAHPEYYEDGGNVDATDDLDYAGLKAYLEGEFVRARAIRYEIHYRRILKNDRDGWDVAYTYSASYKLPDGEAEVWHREVADNQLVLVAAGDSFKIVAGM